MVSRNTGYAKTRVSTEAAKRLYPRRDRTTALSEERAQEKLTVRFHLPSGMDKKSQARKMVKELQKSPLGRLIAAIATTPELRPEKVEQGRKLLQCRDSELNEKLVQTMERVMEELSYNG